jgi:radical S-adenosyl methionine domain-containing protein 2
MTSNGSNRRLPPLTINLAINFKCNYSCRFCFGGMRGYNHHFNYDRILDLPQIFSKAGCKKLTIEGGEPFLSPYLGAVLARAKEVGLKTCVVTNGSYVSKQYLDILSPYLDWLGLSIDTQHEKIEKWMGRGDGKHIENSSKVTCYARELGLKLKVNSVITSRNWMEDMKEFIESLKPDMWKVFQVLPILNENDDKMDDLSISDEQFEHFVKANSSINETGIKFRSESNEEMKGSYLMCFPDGHFFNNNGGIHQISEHSVLAEEFIKVLREI